MFCHLKVVEATPPLSTLQSSDASKLEQRWLTIVLMAGSSHRHNVYGF